MDKALKQKPFDGDVRRRPDQSLLSNVLRLLLTTPLVIFMSSNITAASGPLLPPCPSTPNCVSSLATDNHFIEPLKFSGEAATAWANLRDILSKRPDTRTISGDESKLQVEFRTTLGFVDEGLFVLDESGSVIQCRSAARTGYWDLGKNRRRLEEIRQEFSRHNR